MKLIYSLGLVYLSLLIFSGCTTPKTSDSESSTNTQVSWYDKMQELAEVFVEISPSLVDQKSFERNSQKLAFREKSKKLQQLVSQINSHQDKPHFDPTLSIVSSEFDRQIRLASRALQNRNFPESFERFKLTQSYCITCHTLIETHTDAFTQIDFGSRLENLGPFERGDLWLALRRFSSALLEFEKGLASAKSLKTPIDSDTWVHYFEKLLALSIRVNNDPNLTLEFVSRFLDSQSFPSDSAKQTALAWREEILRWRSQKTKSVSRSLEKNLLSQAEGLLELARTKPGIQGKVSVYRASAIIHNYLASNPTAVRTPRWLFMAGQAAESESAFNLNGVLPVGYYERCILNAPGTSTAQACFDALERWVGNSKFSGLPTPDHQTWLRLKLLGSRARTGSP